MLAIFHAGGGATAEFVADAAGIDRARRAGELGRARAYGERAHDRLDCRVRCGVRVERPQIHRTIGFIVTHGAHDRQAWRGFGGEFHPGLCISPARCPVVAWLLLIDQAQFANACFERCCADNRRYRHRDADHLAHAPTLLGSSEVAAHASADVARSTDVQGLSFRVVEDIDARLGRQAIGEMSLRALRSGDATGERLEILDRVHP